MSDSKNNAARALSGVQRLEARQNQLKQNGSGGANIPRFLLVKLTTQDSTDFSKYGWQVEVRSLASADAATHYKNYSGVSLSGSLTTNPCYDMFGAGGSCQVGDHVVIMQTSIIASDGTPNLAWLIVGKPNVEYVGYVGGTDGGQGYPPSWTYKLYSDSALTKLIAEHVGVSSAARFAQTYVTPGSGKVLYWWNTVYSTPVPEITKISEATQIAIWPA